MRRRQGWSVFLLLREALLNVFAWRSGGTFIIAFAIFAGAGQVVYMSAQWERLEASLLEQESRGHGVYDFAAADVRLAAAISRTSCDHLDKITGVDSAGIIQEERRESFTQIGSTVRVVAVSQTLVKELEHYDAVVGSALGFQPGTEVTLFSPNLGFLHAVVGGVQESRLALGSAVAVALPPDRSTAETCTATLVKNAESRELVPVLQSSLHVSGGSIVAAERFTSTHDLTAAYLDRVERFFPLLLGVAGASIAFVSYKLRSNQLAAYRLSGTSRVDLMVLLMFEQALASGVFVTASVTATVVMLLSRDSTPYATSGWALLGGITWLLTFTLSAALLSRQNVAQLAKDG